jgi:asparagine synthase (glutamine-hydrolysing)
LGIKPLYYCESDQGLFFSSEIKALVKSKILKAEVNQSALHEYLTYQFCLEEKTLFKGIQKINPGHFAKGKVHEPIHETKYWDTNYSIDQYHSEDYLQEQLINLLHDSVKIQMRSDVPVGVYLSGGVDSSAVAMLANEHAGGGLSVFHGKFNEGAAFDESYYARKIAQEISANWHEVIPTSTDFVKEFQNLIYYLDEPVAGPGSFPQLLVSKLAAKNVKVVLGGQGGDELFCGYARYLIGYLEQSLKGGIFETQEEGKHIVQLSTIIKSLPLLKEYVPLIKSFWQDGLFGEMDARYFRLIDRSPNLEKLLHPDLIRSYRKDEIFSGFQKIFNHPDTSSYINKMTHFDLKTLLPALLQVEDRMSMAASLESRVPLLDHRIVDFVTSMPPATKFNAGQTKYILKKALKNIVPPEVLHRKDKMGFPVPINIWLTTPSFKSFVNDLLLSKASKERGVFSVAEIERMINTDQGFSRQLWGALSLEVWFQTFIDK